MLGEGNTWFSSGPYRKLVECRVSDSFACRMSGVVEIHSNGSAQTLLRR